MNDQLLTMVEREVLSWPGVTSEPGRFGAPESDHTQGSYNPLAKPQQSKEETDGCRENARTASHGRPITPGPLRHLRANEDDRDRGSLGQRAQGRSHHTELSPVAGISDHPGEPQGRCDPR
jgi:hypothetical protein